MPISPIKGIMFITTLGKIIVFRHFDGYRSLICCLKIPEKWRKPIKPGTTVTEIALKSRVSGPKWPNFELFALSKCFWRLKT